MLEDAESESGWFWSCQRTPQSDSHYSHYSCHLRQSPIHPSTQTTEPPPAARDPTVAWPTRFDVRMMSMDELQEVLENRMALLDVAPSDPPRLPEVSPEVAEATEDFPHDDE